MIDHPDTLRYMLFYFVDYSYCVKWKGKNVRSGIRTHAGRNRLRPESSTLDRSMIDHPDILRDMLFYFVDYNYCVKWKGKIVRSGIRTHADWRTRLRPERSALDRSAP